MRFDAPMQPPTQSIEIKQFTGIDLNRDPSQIDVSKSPDMMNIVIDEDGTPDKRPGYTRCFESIGTGNINGLIDYNGGLVIAHGTKVYMWDMTNAPVEIYSGVTDSAMRGFVFEDKLYLINGHEYLVYDGSTCGVVVPYVPTLTVSTAPSGGGTALDQWNLIGKQFRQLFDGDGTTKDYQLVISGLDADELVVTINGMPATDFTVNRTTGLLTFTSAPADGTNNVEIIASKTVSGAKEKIIGCNRFNIYGGTNDTRVHLFGNVGSPSTVYRCGLNDPTYWPENDFNNFGTSTPVTGQVNQYDTSVVFKTDGIWQETFELDDNGSPTWPTKPINSTVGCIAPDSLQLIENAPVFVSKLGITQLVSSNVRDERNINVISEPINSALLKRDLKNAVAVDYDGCYMLSFSDGYVWVWNYRTNVWFPWNNIMMLNCVVKDNTLYFGSANGMVYRMKKVNDDLPYNDDGEAINAYWQTKLFDFDAQDYEKLVNTLHLTLRSGASVATKVQYRHDKYSAWRDMVTSLALDTSLFNYSTLDYSKLMYMAGTMPKHVVKKVKIKKIIYLQLMISNSDLNRNMGVLTLTLKYTIQNEVKK